MEFPLAILSGIFIAVAVYLLLCRAMIRMILGVVILGNGPEAAPAVVDLLEELGLLK